MYRVFTVALLCLCGACIQQNQQQDFSATFVKLDLSTDLIDFKTLEKNGDLGESQTIKVPYDPFFKTSKTYEAYPFRKILSHYLENTAMDTLNTMVIFECTDGYQPSVPLVTLLKANSYLAFHDYAAPENQHWPKELADKLGPFYLVWPNADNDFQAYPWPYALTNMRFENQKELFAAAYPHTKEAVKGFQLYQKKCMKCHSVNKVGGTMGIEFNHPKNITEYWKEDHIWEFIQNPQSYRYNSKMPPIQDLNKEQFEEIITYLKSMKGQQI